MCVTQAISSEKNAQYAFLYSLTKRKLQREPVEKERLQKRTQIKALWQKKAQPDVASHWFNPSPASPAVAGGSLAAL